MTQLSFAIGRPVLADRLFSRGIVMDGVLVAAGAALTAIAAQVVVPLWPVPITGQTLAVLLVGSSLGALRGTLSMLLYAVLGIIGLPVFSEASSGLGVVLGASGGYIIGFIFAAAFTGWIAQRSWDRRILRAILAFLGGTVLVYAVGLPWLSFTLGYNLVETLNAGFFPFIIGGIVKMLIAAAVITVGWTYIDREDQRRASVELANRG
ncbi:MAG: biotin transporter BioY [Terrimesophilobacter sp.]